jgi:hypothetical protein
MRLRLPLLVLLLLGACREEPSFDERYSDTANAIEERAANLDAELNAAEARNDQST